MPLYNGARWVEQSLVSVLAQTRPPDEIIVVNDGSTDGGAGVAIVERIRQAHPQIRLLHKPNGGQSSARNFAVRLSRSRLIAFIDQDDCWYPNHLQDLIRAAQKHKGLPLGWIYSDFDDIDANGLMVRRSFVDHITNPKRDLITILREGIIIQPSATLVTREAFEAVGGFDEKLSGYEDDDLFLRIFRAGFDNVFVPRSTSQWRVHDSSCGASDRNDASLRYYAQKLIKMFPNDRWRGHYYVRDVIAPRFIHTWLQMYVRASRYDNRAKMIEYANDALALTRYLRPKRRFIFSLLLRILASRPVVAMNLPESSFWDIGSRIARVLTR